MSGGGGGSGGRAENRSQMGGKAMRGFALAEQRSGEAVMHFLNLLDM